MPDGSSTAHLYRPKFATVLKEGYALESFQEDMVAALTVAIVALPLSMAIAVGSGVSPERGLYTSIVGGFIVSALGGSRFQIGGPAGAFIVLVSATVTQFGIEGLLLAVALSGIMLMAIGALRLGTLIRYIPHAVTIGFTCGIALTIFAGQVKDLLGLKLAGPEPGPFFPKIAALSAALPTLSTATFAIGAGTVTIIVLVRRFRPTWPGMLIAVACASLAAPLFSGSIETIGSRFGGIPSGLQWPQLPVFSWALFYAVVPSAISFTLLGSIESLLSAKVADGMTGRKHRSNMELVAQGIANVGSSLFGGICVTGTIARTATNIRAGARSPVSGMAHSLFLLLFMMIAAPLAKFIPLSALAGVLAAVCWFMAEKKEFVDSLRDWRTAMVLLATFILTVVRDLSSGVVAGCFLAGLLAFSRRPVSIEGDPVPGESNQS